MGDRASEFLDRVDNADLTDAEWACKYGRILLTLARHAVKLAEASDRLTDELFSDESDKIEFPKELAVQYRKWWEKHKAYEATVRSLPEVKK